MGQIGGVGGGIDGGRELSIVEQKMPFLGSLLRRIITGVNTLATNTATSATGEIAAPKPPDSVAVSTFGEYMHVSISHGGSLQRGVRYFTEIGVNDPTFSQPIVIDHGSSRTSHPFPLPTNASGGDSPVPHQYYVRSYAQYLSSQPSPPTTVGGASSPTAFTMGGTTVGTPLQSSGSGTAANSGQQGGWGMGKTQSRS
ncbi:MAG: hypothetical protein ACLGXA_24405 [Acidobacteriota bacterium]